jgi:hypothetical protein
MTLCRVGVGAVLSPIWSPTLSPQWRSPPGRVGPSVDDVPTTSANERGSDDRPLVANIAFGDP